MAAWQALGTLGWCCGGYALDAGCKCVVNVATCFQDPSEEHCVAALLPRVCQMFLGELLKMGWTGAGDGKVNYIGLDWI